jgi:hypothetical protein
MSVDLLARNVINSLLKIKEAKILSLRRCKPRGPTVVENAVIEASSCEEIALFAVDVNATIDAINLAIDTIEAEYKKLINPEEPGTETNQQARINYG